MGGMLQDMGKEGRGRQAARQKEKEGEKVDGGYNRQEMCW